MQGTRIEDGGHFYRCDACGLLFPSERAADGWRCYCKRLTFPRPGWHPTAGVEVGRAGDPRFTDDIDETDPLIRHVGTLADYLGCS